MVDSARYTSLWAYLDITHQSRIRQLRDILNAALNTDTYQLETDPHITLHRGFQIPSQNILPFLEFIKTIDLVDTTIQVTGVKVWPSVNDPHVVMLDLGLELDDYHATLSDMIAEHGGTEFHDPVPPHITLLRAGLAKDLEDWDGLTQDDQDRLFTTQNALQFPWELTITDATLGLYGLPQPD